MKKGIFLLALQVFISMIINNYPAASGKPVIDGGTFLSAVPAPLPPPVISTIGPTGTYVSITAALASLQSTGTVNPLIWELQSTYVSSVETFPVSFSTINLNGINATNTLTIRPQSGAIGLLITSSAATTINLNGGHHVTFDGRPGGSGTVSQLRIDNTLATGVSLLFNNLASNNSILYIELTGINTSVLSGVVVIGTTTPAGILGNSDNLIDHCIIHDGLTKPATLLYCLGSPGKLNLNNTVSNCRFYNWNITTVNSRGLCVDSYNSGMMITGNSFYQTASTTGVSSTQPSAMIGLAGAANTNNITVTNNYLGGSAPLCGGAPLAVTSDGNAAYLAGMNVNVGSTTATSIQGNTISNIVYTMASGNSASFVGISLVSGWVNLGTVSPNIIGSQTVANSISFIFNSTGNTGVFAGINVNNILTTDITSVSNNVICGIAISAASNQGISFSAIAASSASTLNVVISGNTIGSISLPNAISNSSKGYLHGIHAVGSTTTVITGNIIANLTESNTANASNQLIGIYAPGNPLGIFNISNNTIFNLASAAPSVGTGATASVIGLSFNATGSAGQVISNNAIYNLSNSALTAAVNVIGLYYAGIASGTNLVSGNFIHSLSLATAATTANITGIYESAGMSEYQNNLVRLGINGSGASINNGYAINGIYELAGTNNNYFNSVYIGGTGVTGVTSSTFAFNSAATTTARTVQNNLLVNARSGGTTGKHYAITVAGTAPNPAGLICDYNDLYASGITGGVLGLFNLLDQSTLVAWQLATGQDTNSVSADPLFTNPTGATGSIDFHVAASAINNAGLTVAGITTDYDGLTRTNPPDIGAYEFSLPTITAPDTVCKVSTGNVYSTEAGNTNYQWAVSAGGTITAGGGTTDNTVTVSWNSAGVETVSVNYTIPSGIPSPLPAIYNVVFFPDPLPVISGPDITCAGSGGNVYTTEAGMTAYSWNVSAGSHIASGGTASDNFVVVTWGTAGNAFVSVSYIDANGCISPVPTIYPVTLNLDIPVNVILTANAWTVTSGTTVNFTATPTISGITPIYEWYVNDIRDMAAGGNTYSYTPLAGDMVKVILSLGGNCTNSAVSSNIITIAVNQVLPAYVIIVADANPVCKGTTVNFTAQALNTGSSPAYQWYNGQIPVGTNSPFYSYIPSDGDSISLVVTQGNPCISGPLPSNAIRMQVNPPPATAAFIADNTTPPYASDVHLIDQSTGTPISWRWSFNPTSVTYVNGTDSTSQNPTIQFTISGLYSVTLTINAETCADMMTRTDYIYVGVPGLWVGRTSNNWDDAPNWDNYIIPYNLTDVLIPASAAIWPVYTGNLIVGNDCGNMVLSGPVSHLTVTGNMSILNGYSVTNQGVIIIQGH
jgi:hypothetical protein